MATRTKVDDPVFERATARLTATIVNPFTGAGFKPETLTLTLYDAATKGVINTRTTVNVLDTNGGTVSAEGELEFELLPADNVIVTKSRSVHRERHIALFEFTWASGVRSGKHEVEFSVVDSLKVDPPVEEP